MGVTGRTYAEVAAETQQAEARAHEQQQQQRSGPPLPGLGPRLAGIAASASQVSRALAERDEGRGMSDEGSRVCLFGVDPRLHRSVTAPLLLLCHYYTVIHAAPTSDSTAIDAALLPRASALASAPRRPPRAAALVRCPSVTTAALVDPAGAPWPVLVGSPVDNASVPDRDAVAPAPLL